MSETPDEPEVTVTGLDLDGDGEPDGVNVTEITTKDVDGDGFVDVVTETSTSIIDVDGYEGPLHVLLALARTQKVDLAKLSVLKLAEQYLAFVQEARRRPRRLSTWTAMVRPTS